MIIVSACLAGDKCRYDGDSCSDSSVTKLFQNEEIIKVCPEQLGGLSTPRPPAERCGEKIITNTGLDVTDAFNKGAQMALEIAIKEGVTQAIVKEKSPMCGYQKIYDGSFSGSLINESGVFTKLLLAAGIKVEARH